MKMCNIGCLIILCATFQLIHCQFYKFEYTQADETDWTPPAFDPADFAEDRVSGEPCECVMFYQCDKNTKRIIDSGSGLVRWRNGGSDSPKKCEKVGEVCCKPPLWAEKNEEEQPNDFLKPASGTNIETSSEGLNYWNLPDSENEPNGQPRPNPDGNNPDSQPGDQDYYDSANQNGEPQENSPGSLLSCGEKRVSTVDYRNTALRVSGPELETQTKFGEFPWMIMIHQIVRNETDLPTLRLFVCGGSLIHPQIVMTAAHCISGKTKIEDLVVRAGEYDTSTESEPIKHQDRLVDSIVNHPLYNETNPMHDIALIYLKKPFVLADNVNTICLPEEGEIYVGEHCVGTGWGRDGNGKRTETQNLLRKAELPIVPRDQCQQMLRKTRLGKYFRLHESFLCAGGDEMDLCTGDGGGPLTCYNEKTQSEVQVGITSWGIKCGVIGVPGVYTDVLVHRDWITGTVDYLLNGTNNQPNANDVPNGNEQDSSSDSGNWGTNPENPGEDEISQCTCVEPDQCDEQDTVIITEDSVQVDWRLGGSQCTNPQVCCLKPIESQTEWTEPETETELPGLPETPKEPLNCGERRNFDDTQNLQAGGFAKFAEFPWVLKLRNSEDNKVTPDTEAFRCGASLVHPSLALTAAHCLINSTSPESIIVRAGEYDVTTDTEELPYQERNVRKIVMHPEFDYKHPKNDIAILVLDQPFDMTDNVNVVCLQTNDDIIDTTRCAAAGWGQTDPEGEMQNVLKKIEMPIVPTTECQNSLRNTRLGKFFKLHDSFLCAGGDNADTCVGDGGGPLMCPVQNPDVYVQVGVVSWGINCAKAGRPGVYVDVQKFHEWIYQVASEENMNM